MTNEVFFWLTRFFQLVSHLLSWRNHGLERPICKEWRGIGSIAGIPPTLRWTKDAFTLFDMSQPTIASSAMAWKIGASDVESSIHHIFFFLVWQEFSSQKSSASIVFENLPKKSHFLARKH